MTNAGEIIPVEPGVASCTLWWPVRLVDQLADQPRIAMKARDRRVGREEHVEVVIGQTVVNVVGGCNFIRLTILMTRAFNIGRVPSKEFDSGERLRSVGTSPQPLPSS